MTNWQEMGVWAVGTFVNQPPAVLSVSPSSGSGWSRSFTFVASDANGFADLESVHILIHSGLNASNACYVAYVRGDNRLWMLSDQGTAWLGPVTAGAAGTLQNSQCSVSAAESGASGSGNTLTLNLALSFKASFAGLRRIYALARDLGGLTTSWQELGTWAVQ
jgi:hypothetical protein